MTLRAVLLLRYAENERLLYGAAEMPEIVVYAAEGRTIEQKKKLLKAVTAAVADSFEIDANSVTVSIIETPKHHKSKGGVPFDER
ncbi:MULTISPECIES: tautomerase family protein [Pantoea]|uniref:tautomerase family protein n=2 Tax=Erwiniaceae TaxID=1903409 RepID=UPI001CE10D1F|nr:MULTISPECIES: tautomerase family protein [Pantoea]